MPSIAIVILPSCCRLRRMELLLISTADPLDAPGATSPPAAKQDVSQYENGIAPLEFGSLRVISYPGGQQFGAISPCEMNEFSDECDAWEKENGPYTKGEYMVRSNPRTKGY
jgi:hypothetical protein